MEDDLWDIQYEDVEGLDWMLQECTYLDCFTTTSTITESEDSKGDVKIPKKRGRKRKYDPDYPRRRIAIVPRLLKRDFRRSLPAMLFNVLNSGSIMYYHQFLTEHCQPDFIMEMNLPEVYLSVQEKGFNVFLQGKTSVLEHYKTCIEKYPDVTFQLSNTSLIQWTGVDSIQFKGSIEIDGNRLLKDKSRISQDETLPFTYHSKVMSLNEIPDYDPQFWRLQVFGEVLINVSSSHRIISVVIQQ